MVLLTSSAHPRFALVNSLETSHYKGLRPHPALPVEEFLLPVFGGPSEVWSPVDEGDADRTFRAARFDFARAVRSARGYPATARQDAELMMLAVSPGAAALSRASSWRPTSVIAAGPPAMSLARSSVRVVLSMRADARSCRFAEPSAQPLGPARLAPYSHRAPVQLPVRPLPQALHPSRGRSRRLTPAWSRACRRTPSTMAIPLTTSCVSSTTSGAPLTTTAISSGSDRRAAAYQWTRRWRGSTP